jgi:photosystem II stability/assembly factor-like uncharacterized protein
VNRLTGTLLLVIAWSALSLPVSAQWKQATGPEGGLLNALLHDGSILFVGGRDGVYRSRNSGDSWIAANRGMQAWSTVLALAKRGGTLLAGTANEGVYRSTDNGDSWINRSVGLPEYAQVRALCAAGSKFFCGAGGVVHASSDDGLSWAPSGTGLPATGDVRSIVSADGGIYVGYGFGYGVYRSTDEGEHWSAVNDGLPALQLVASLAVSGDTVYAGLSDQGVYVSTDAGGRWTPMRAGLPDAEITALHASDDGVYAGSNIGTISHAMGAGDVWADADSGLAPACAVNGIHVRDGTEYVATCGGLYRRLDGAIAFTFERSGMRNGFIKCFASLSTVSFASNDGCGVSFSNDAGAWWLSRKAGLRGYSVNALLPLGNALYAATFGDGVFVSPDSGVSWNACGAGLNSPRVLSLHADGGKIYAGTRNGLNGSTDGGATWSDMNGGALTDLDISVIASDSATVYIGADYYGFLASTNQGSAWQLRNNGIPADPVFHALLLDGSVFYAALGFDGVYMSTNSGVVWARIGLTLPPYTFAYALMLHDGALFLGSNNGVFLSRDRGVTWFDISDGLPSGSIVRSLTTANTVSGVELLAGTDGQSVWRRALSEITAIAAAPISAQEISLAQNYPNPFGGADIPGSSTSISFSLLKSARTRISVQNVLGEEVAILADGIVPAGEHTVRFDGAGLPSGLYTCVLRAGDAHRVMKMLLAR